MRSVAVAVALIAAPAGAVDVVVFDRGGGPARVAAVAEQVVAGGDVVLGAADTAELDAAYAATCADAACYARAGAAGGVAQVILVEREVLRVIDVAAAERRLFAADATAVRAALQALRAGKLGRLDTSAVPGARLIVDGNDYRGEDVVAGSHVVDVYADGRAVVVEVDVPAGGVGVVPPLPAVASPDVGVGVVPAVTSPEPGLHPGVVVAGSGAVVLAAGLGLAVFNGVVCIDSNGDGSPENASCVLVGNTLPDAKGTSRPGLEMLSIGLIAAGALALGAGGAWSLTEQ